MMAEHTSAYPDPVRELRFCPLGVDVPGTLGKEQISRYNEQGFLAPVNVFGDRDIAGIRGTCKTLDPRLPRPSSVICRPGSAPPIRRFEA